MNVRRGNRLVTYMLVDIVTTLLDLIYVAVLLDMICYQTEGAKVI